MTSQETKKKQRALPDGVSIDELIKRGELPEGYMAMSSEERATIHKAERETARKAFAARKQVEE